MNGVIRVWVNGRTYDSAAPALSAVDHGLTVGDGVFETCKVVDGRPFALTRHKERLERSATGLGLGPVDLSAVDEGIAAVLSQGEPIAFGRLRITVTAGAGPLGSDRDESPMTYVVTAAPQERSAPTTTLAVTPWTRNERAPTAGLKTTSYADNVLALGFARERGAGEAILANSRGELCECTGSNVFVVLGERVHTPPPSSGCLAGITRALTIEWAREAGIEVIEEAMPLGVLRTADEVFVTSSLRDVQAVSAIDEHVVPAAPGPVTATVAQVFADRAARENDP